MTQCCFVIWGSGRWPLRDEPCNGCPYRFRNRDDTTNKGLKTVPELINKCEDLRERAEKAEAEVERLKRNLTKVVEKMAEDIIKEIDQ